MNEELRKIATQNFEIWNDSLQTKEPEKVAALYSDDATFLPTVLGEFKRGKTGAKEYFVHFLEKNPSGRIVQDEVQEISQDKYLHCGHYDFEIDNKDEGATSPRKTVNARFSYVWKKKEDGSYEILHHHSSLKP
ncbi:MAG: SgcJ/EcaC family oxidoreductase [Candidatus Gracilibacteria bacterium]|jgi:uncharacterized protein (TIGR02246 family)|nr:SgcJ/EcaC family oxidoreductase [Candidatus Gracilibacteria bacterium]